MIYRRSADPQSAVALDWQIKACKQFAAENGWVLVGDYVDDGTSGHSGERPAWQRLINDAAARRFDGIVAADVDRLSRNPFELARLVDVCDKNSVSIRTATASWFDLPDDQRRLWMHAFLNGAHMQRKVHSERINTLLAARRARLTESVDR